MCYNVLLITTAEANAGVKLVVPTMTIKSTLTCTKCGKTSHLVETCHNIKKEELVMPTIIVKSTKHLARTKTQPVKSRKIPIHYPCIICYSVEQRFKKCLRKIEVHNMLRTKPPKINNMLVNVIVVVTTHNQ
jgi:hypothetical protein